MRNRLYIGNSVNFSVYIILTDEKYFDDLS